MTEETKKTIGQASVELAAKHDYKQGVIDTQREMMKTYVDDLIKCAKRGEKAYGKEDTFYVCVQTKRERLMHNVIRNLFYYRRTRPAPTYDLALYWYDPKSEDLRFVWNIPDKETVEMMQDPAYVPPRDHSQLYGFVKSFIAGTLY